MKIIESGPIGSDYVLIAEIAKALGVTKRAVEIRAAKGRARQQENPWEFIQETVKGGKRKCFYLPDLPEDVRKAVTDKRQEEQCLLTVKTISENASEAELYNHFLSGTQLGKQTLKKREEEVRLRQQKKEEGMKLFSGLSKDSDKFKRAKAKEWLVLRAIEFQHKQNIGIGASYQAIASAVNSRVIEVPDHVAEWLPCKDGVRTLSAKSVERWTHTYNKQGIWGLTDGYGKRKGQSKIATNDTLRRIVIGSMLQNPHIKASEILEYLRAEHADMKLPGIRSIQRFMKEWKEENAQIWTYTTNPDEWKNTYMAAPGSHFENIKAPNQLWEMDSTPGDWMLKDGRHSVIGVIDMWSRRLKLYVSKTSRAQAVCQLFRQAILDWGVPESVRTDNGKDYVSELFCGALRSMEIDHEICTPFASEEKGTIERALKTMSHSILDLLPGFIGHSVADRKQIEARKSFAERIMKRESVVDVELTSDELQEKLNDWVEYVYERKSHSGLDGKSPFEQFTSWTGAIRRIKDERALDMLLAEVAGERTIGKKGVRFGNHFYFSDGLFEYAGQQAQLKYDEQNMGILYAYIDGQFIGSVTCHDLLGISRKEAAVAAKSKQKKLLAEQRKEYKEYTKEISKNMAQAVLDHRREQSSNVTAMPKRSEEYSSYGLKEAAAAAQSSEFRQSAVSDQCNSSVININQANKVPVHILNTGTDKEKYELWNKLNAQVKAGITIDDERLLRFYHNFTNTPEYSVQKEMAEMRQSLKARGNQ